MGGHRLAVALLTLMVLAWVGSCAVPPGTGSVAFVKVVVTAPPPEVTPATDVVTKALISGVADPLVQEVTVIEETASEGVMANEVLDAMVSMAVETVVALVSTGTPTLAVPTPTPAPPTPTHTPTPLLIPLELLTPSPTPAPTAAPTVTPSVLPAEVRGKILFLTDRFKQKKRDKPAVLAMDPDGSHVALVTNRWVYDRAKDLNRTSPQGTQKLYVQDTSIWVVNYDGWREFFFDLGGVEYEPAWAPDSTFVAFVSNLPGNDELFVLNRATGDVKRLTHNAWEWDKHPSFSPDGSQIVFWSNRVTGHKQIWKMGADGSHPVNLSNNPYDDYDPVWIR